MSEPDPLDWSLLQAFLAVAEEGSLSAAARRLDLSQPTLGRHIRNAERRLGVPLFRRHPRGLALTDQGAHLLAEARAMQEAARRIALTAAGEQEALAGVVRITASVMLSIHHLPAIIARLRAEEPAIQVELVPSDQSRNLLFREADIAVRMYRPTQLDLVASHLGDIELGVYATSDYLDRAGRPASLMDLDVIGYDADPGLIQGFAAAGQTVTRDWFPVRCDDNAAYWALVCAGAGAGFGQVPIARRTPGLERIHVDFPLPVLPVWLTAHEGLRATPRLRRVWDALAEGLRPLCRSA